MPYHVLHFFELSFQRQPTSLLATFLLSLLLPSKGSHMVLHFYSSICLLDDVLLTPGTDLGNTEFISSVLLLRGRKGRRMVWQFGTCVVKHQSIPCHSGTHKHTAERKRTEFVLVCVCGW